MIERIFDHFSFLLYKNYGMVWTPICSVQREGFKSYRYSNSNWRWTSRHIWWCIQLQITKPGGGNNTQASVFSGKDRIHCLKFTTVGGPDGLRELLSFVLGRRQDKYGLINSGVNTEIQIHRPFAEHEIIYFDKGYESLTYCRAAHHEIANRNIVWKIIENMKMKRPRGVCI